MANYRSTLIPQYSEVNRTKYFAIKSNEIVQVQHIASLNQVNYLMSIIFPLQIQVKHHLVIRADGSLQHGPSSLYSFMHIQSPAN